MKKIILKFTKIYQKTISQMWVVFGGSTAQCRFYPSCSQYTYDAVEKYGIMKGVLKGMWRVLRCSPLSKGGFDPV